MSATVTGQHGPVVLSPTGVNALEAIACSTWLFPTDIHPATRLKLTDAGLIEGDEVITVTELGRAAVAELVGP